MNIEGKLIGLKLSMNRKPVVEIKIDSDIAVIEQEYNALKDAPVSVKVEKKRGKRSLDANAYMWELCSQIADKLSDDGELHTKEDVYRENVKQVGVYKDMPMLAEGIDTLRKAWEMHGTGWVTEIVDYLHNMDGYLVRCYYGSSLYNTKQMSRLIDNVVQDAQALGIDTRTPEEINNMLSLWEQAEKQRKEKANVQQSNNARSHH